MSENLHSPESTDAKKQPVQEVTRTKSIMNASGSSGAVVSNTPEGGLKRAPTVTFSGSEVNTAATEPSSATDTLHRDLNELSFATFSTRLENSASTKEGACVTPGNITPKSLCNTSDGGNEHPRFVVDDSLHSPPSNRNKSNSTIATSPRGSIVAATMNAIRHKENEIMNNHPMPSSEVSAAAASGSKPPSTSPEARIRSSDT